MHRRPLLDLLERHKPFDESEAESLRRIEAFVRENPRCFDRSLAIGHVTGSAWLINAEATRALLTHHRKLGMWLQPGGHADGDPDVLTVALCEAREESGLSGIVPVDADVFDVDVHPIPPLGSEAAHFHYDIRFLLQARGPQEFRVSGESHDLAWVGEGDLPRLNTDDSVRRMFRKWRHR